MHCLCPLFIYLITNIGIAGREKKDDSRDYGGNLRLQARCGIHIGASLTENRNKEGEKEDSDRITVSEQCYRYRVKSHTGKYTRLNRAKIAKIVTHAGHSRKGTGKRHRKHQILSYRNSRIARSFLAETDTLDFKTETGLIQHELNQKRNDNRKNNRKRNIDFQCTERGVHQSKTRRRGHRSGLP